VKLEFQLVRNQFFISTIGFFNGSLWWHFTSENTIVDIKNYVFDIKNSIFDIKNVILDINNLIVDIKLKRLPYRVNIWTNSKSDSRHTDSFCFICSSRNNQMFLQAPVFATKQQDFLSNVNLKCLTNSTATLAGMSKITLNWRRVLGHIYT